MMTIKGFSYAFQSIFSIPFLLGVVFLFGIAALFIKERFDCFPKMFYYPILIVTLGKYIFLAGLTIYVLLCILKREEVFPRRRLKIFVPMFRLSCFDKLFCHEQSLVFMNLLFFRWSMFFCDIFEYFTQFNVSDAA